MPLESDYDDIISELHYYYSFLSGIVSEDYVVVFEAGDTNLTKAYGIYADPFGSFFDTMCCDEYCIQEYSKETIKPIWFLTDFDNKLFWNEDEEWTEKHNKDYVQKKNVFYKEENVCQELM